MLSFMFLSVKGVFCWKGLIMIRKHRGCLIVANMVRLLDSKLIFLLHIYRYYIQIFLHNLNDPKTSFYNRFCVEKFKYVYRLF